VQILSLGTLLNLKVTRLDAAIDYCPFTPRHLLHAQELGLSRTHAQSHGWASNTDGDTFTLGSGKSDVYLRCYDRRGFTRTELQLRRGHAQEFFAGLMSRSEAEFPELFLGSLRSFVDFVNVDACKNIFRAPLLPFWRSFVGMVDKLRIAPARAVPVVEKYLTQARKYAAMFHVYASLVSREGRSLASVLTELYTHGSSHLKPHHRLLLARGECLII
jgi:DNA relaxase NicK